MDHDQLDTHRRLPRAYWFCLFAMAGVCLVRFGMWKLSDAFLEIVFFPFLLGGLLLAAIGAVWALIHLARRARADGWMAASPLLVSLFGAIVAFGVIPGSEMGDAENFRRYRAEREEVVRLVQAEKLEKLPNSPRFRKLPWRHRHLSDGGEILVDQPNGNTGVLFYTFRGLLSGGSRGIVYTLGDNPERLGLFSQLEKLDDHWYRFATDD